MFRIVVAGILLSLAHAIAAMADDAPAGLYGKSVVVVWGETRMQRNVGQPKFYQVVAVQTLSIYVSVNGRVFNRFGLQTGAGAAATDQVAGSEGARRIPKFNGQSMTMPLLFTTGGARNVAVEFGSKFDDCKAKITLAKKPGNELEIGFSNITKKFIEFQSLTPDDASCKIQDGNVFADK